MTCSVPKLKAAARKSDDRRLTNAERSAYFARREAAKVLQRVLQGDACRSSPGSIKSLVYSPSVRNKKGTYALVCQTLKHLSIIRDVLETANALNGKWRRQKELTYIITFDILFGQEIPLVGAAEKFLLLQKDALQSALARLLVSKGVKKVEDLMAVQQSSDVSRSYYVRINTLKLDVESALHELRKKFKVEKDDMIADLLILPPGTDLHDHPLVENGSVFIQGKASSMVAVALDPKPGWEVLDACAAPGNKTAHLAALMKGRGKIIACELNRKRIRRLNDTIRLSGASNVKSLNGDFLNLDPNDPVYSKVRAILLDPSCSGSGTAVQRLDHLLPSYTAGNDSKGADTDRLNNLAAFQKKALQHALSFPATERIVYSTCSINQTENEDVIKSVLAQAASYGFQLATPFPNWPQRGLPVLEGSECLLRTDPKEDKEGFFIALFVRKKTATDHSLKPIASSQNLSQILSVKKPTKRSDSASKPKFILPFHSTRLSSRLLCPRPHSQGRPPRRNREAQK